MTKLLEWLTGGFLLLALWSSLLKEALFPSLVRLYPRVVFWSPLILVGLFGIFSICVISVRVYGFNDCKEAAQELRGQILEAKRDLKSKGLDVEA